MRRIRYSARAPSQLAAVHEYLSARNQSAAYEVAASIARTVSRIRELPMLGKMTDEADAYVIVEPHYRYRIFYSIKKDEIVVIRILHGTQA